MTSSLSLMLPLAVPCAPGSFLNSTGPTATCNPCPFNHYQDESEQTECRACPNGTFTIARGSDERGHCRGIMQSFWDSTLIPKTSLYKMHPFMQLPVVLALYHGVGLLPVRSVRRAFISQKVELPFVTSVTLAK